jgi:AcrR family transcriptional regulator
MNPRLYVKDPEQSTLGKSIIEKSISLVQQLGFEDFTFRKLAAEIGTTEASVYRYFENKHRLLTYIITWFWTCLEYQLVYHTNNITDPKQKIFTVIKLITFQLKDDFVFQQIDRNQVFQVVITEGSKPYLTRHVTEDNKDQLFKPYKDLCARIADIFVQYRPGYQFPRSLSSTLLEMAHYQLFFKTNLPSLTDFAGDSDDSGVGKYLEHLVFAALDAKQD